MLMIIEFIRKEITNNNFIRNVSTVLRNKRYSMCCSIPFNWLCWGIPGNASQKKTHYLSLILVLFLFFPIAFTLSMNPTNPTQKNFYTWISSELLGIECCFVWFLIHKQTDEETKHLFILVRNHESDEQIVTNKVIPVNWIQINKLNHTNKKVFLKIEVDQSVDKLRNHEVYFIGLMIWWRVIFMSPPKCTQWNFQI